MNDIENLNDIICFVDGFYQKVRADETLSPVFASRIADKDWPAHLQRMYAFWNALLFAEKGFSGNPMQKHLSLPVREAHFSRWLRLFHQTIDETFAGPKATEAKQRASSIAQLMHYKIQSLSA